MSEQTPLEKLHRVVLTEPHGLPPESLDYLPAFLEHLPAAIERLPEYLGIAAQLLDRSADSLKRLEAAILAKYPTPEDIDASQAETVVAAAGYIGETLREAVPGCDWIVQRKPDVSAYGRPAIRTPDGRQFSPVGYVRASTCSWRRTGNYIWKGVSRRIEMNLSDEARLSDEPAGHLVERAVRRPRFRIHLYHSDVKAAVDSGESLEDVRLPDHGIESPVTFGELLEHYGFESEEADRFSHERLGSVSVSQTKIVFEVSFGDHYEQTVLDASMAATEIGHDLGLSVYFPFDETWADL